MPNVAPKFSIHSELPGDAVVRELSKLMDRYYKDHSLDNFTNEEVAQLYSLMGAARDILDHTLPGVIAELVQGRGLIPVTRMRKTMEMKDE